MNIKYHLSSPLQLDHLDRARHPPLLLLQVSQYNLVQHRVPVVLAAEKQAIAKLNVVKRIPTNVA